MRGNVSKHLVLFCFFTVSTVVYAAGPYIAYSNPSGSGNQSSSGVSFGMDFDVISAISVSALGAFDDLQNGFTGSITVAIWDRTSTPPAVVPGLSLVITGTDGTIWPMRGDRIVKLGSPVTLPAGFKGSIVAFGYGADMNGNGIVHQPADNFSKTSTGNGLISFLKIARQGTPGLFPSMVTNMSLEAQYGGPTFVFDQQSPPPPRPLLAAINHWWGWLLISIGLIFVFMAIRRFAKK